jgi:hypothetical protein
MYIYILYIYIFMYIYILYIDMNTCTTCGTSLKGLVQVASECSHCFQGHEGVSDSTCSAAAPQVSVSVLLYQ